MNWPATTMLLATTSTDITESGFGELSFPFFVQVWQCVIATCYLLPVAGFFVHFKSFANIFYSNLTIWCSKLSPHILDTKLLPYKLFILQPENMVFKLSFHILDTNYWRINILYSNLKIWCSKLRPHILDANLNMVLQINPSFLGLQTGNNRFILHFKILQKELAFGVWWIGWLPQYY